MNSVSLVKLELVISTNGRHKHVLRNYLTSGISQTSDESPPKLHKAHHLRILTTVRHGGSTTFTTLPENCNPPLTEIRVSDERRNETKTKFFFPYSQCRNPTIVSKTQRCHNPLILLLSLSRLLPQGGECNVVRTRTICMLTDRDGMICLFLFSPP